MEFLAGGALVAARDRLHDRDGHSILNPAANPNRHVGADADALQNRYERWINACAQ
jgi:hypothetical protein